jgi:hypothetical protein
MSEVRTDWGYTAVGATNGRPARIFAVVLLMGMAGLIGVLLLPSTPPTVAPERAIGGGPRAEPTVPSEGAVCHTDDGAPYEADRCAHE